MIYYHTKCLCAQYFTEHIKNIPHVHDVLEPSTHAIVDCPLLMEGGDMSDNKCSVIGHVAPWDSTVETMKIRPTLLHFIVCLYI